MRLLFLAAALLSAGGARADAADPVAAEIEAALEGELSRSSGTLRQEGYPAPYFVGLRASQTAREEVRCSLGGERFHQHQRQAIVTPDVRVGSRELDNHPPAPQAGFTGREIPLDGGGFGVRHTVWRELDEEYKAAAAGFLRKQALRVRRGKTEYDTDDMTAEEPVVRDLAGFETHDELDDGFAGGRLLCRSVSAAFAARPDLLGSRVGVVRQSSRHWLYNTEGSRVRWGSGWSRLELAAEALTSDGFRVQASRVFYSASPTELPGETEAAGAAREVLADLSALEAASSTSPLSAPALLDPSVGASVLQALVMRLSGEEHRNPDGAQTFRDKIGKQVLPEFVTLEDDPTLKDFKGKPLLGAYEVDDEGVEARKAVLVERGVLRGFLLSRYPVLGFSRSGGHGRAAPGMAAMGRAANLVLRSTTTFSQERLLGLLRQEAQRRGKPYGLWIRKARGWSSQDRAGQQQAFRLQPTLVDLVDARTGARTLVRDLDMVGTPLDLIGGLLAAGDDAEAVPALVEQPSGALPVSTIVPTLLVEEVELQRAETKPEKSPVLPPPPR